MDEELRALIERVERRAAQRRETPGQTGAQTTSEELRALIEQVENRSAERGKPRGIGQMLYENFIGSGEADTVGERIGEAIRGAFAGAARGLADVPALPVNLAQLATEGIEKAAGMEEPSAVSRFLESLPDTREMLAAVPVIGPQSEYVAPGRLGRYIAEAAEFAGPAGLLSRAKKVVPTLWDMTRFGAAPGVASEAAGEATEGTALEPYARAAAALGTAVALARPGRFSEATERGRLANVAQDQGIRNITVGQMRQSPGLMRAEGRLQPTQQQLEDVTAAAMRSIGSDAPVATRTALAQANRNIVDAMDEAVAGVDVIPTQNHADAAIELARRYREGTAQANLIPTVRGMTERIRAFAATDRPISLSLLKEWRTNIGNLLQSDNPAAQNAAHALRDIIDDMTDQALTAAGRTDDLAKLAQAREQYRNYLAIIIARGRAGAEAGELSPTMLNQAIKQVQGTSTVVTGRGTPFTEFTEAAAAALRQAPAVAPGAVRQISGIIPAAFGAIGSMPALTAGAGFIPAVLGAAGGAAIGTALPAIGQSIMRSPPVQAMMRNPADVMRQIMPVMPGLLNYEEPR
jgi:hypothetical protein